MGESDTELLKAQAPTQIIQSGPPIVPVMVAPSTVQVMNQPQQQYVPALAPPPQPSQLSAPSVLEVTEAGPQRGVSVPPPIISLRSPARRSVRIVKRPRVVNDTMPKIVPQEEPIFHAPSTVRFTGGKTAQNGLGSVKSLGGVPIDSVFNPDVDVSTAYAN